MFAEFNETNFPFVQVKLVGKPQDENDFNLFINKWKELYNNNKDFIFIFDTINVSNPPLKYSLKMSQFIKQLRKNDYQYLKKSIILINSNKIKHMLEFIFLIQPPVAPVYIYNIENGLEGNILLNQNIEKIINNPQTIYIEPNKPLLGIF